MVLVFVLNLGIIYFRIYKPDNCSIWLSALTSSSFLPRRNLPSPDDETRHLLKRSLFFALDIYLAVYVSQLLNVEGKAIVADCIFQKWPQQCLKPYSLFQNLLAPREEMESVSASLELMRLMAAQTSRVEESDVLWLPNSKGYSFCPGLSQHVLRKPIRHTPHREVTCRCSGQ